MILTEPNIAPGPLLDGISVAASTGHEGRPYIAWNSIDPHATPLNNLAVQTK